MTNIRGVVGVGGGVPIKYHGDVIGAVASSGAVGGDKDELCSQAGIDAVAASSDNEFTVSPARSAIEMTSAAALFRAYASRCR